MKKGRKGRMWSCQTIFSVNFEHAIHDTSFKKAKQIFKRMGTYIFDPFLEQVLKNY